jgi:hypothetical protein
VKLGQPPLAALQDLRGVFLARKLAKVVVAVVSAEEV